MWLLGRKCFSLPTMSEPGTSGGSGANGAPEAVHFTAEQLALIDRLIVARVASSSVNPGGATASGDPSTMTPTNFAGEYLLVACANQGTGLPFVFGSPRGEQPLGRSFAHLCFARAWRPSSAGEYILVAVLAVCKPMHRVATCFRFQEQLPGRSFANLCFARARRPACRSVLTCFPHPCATHLRQALGERQSHGWPVDLSHHGARRSSGTGKPARVWLQS